MFKLLNFTDIIKKGENKDMKHIQKLRCNTGHALTEMAATEPT